MAIYIIDKQDQNCIKTIEKIAIICCVTTCKYFISGRIWDNYQIVNTQNIGVDFNPDIVAVGENVYIVGQGQGENTQAIFFTMSTDDGNNLSKVEYVATGGNLPSVAASS